MFLLIGASICGFGSVRRCFNLCVVFGCIIGVLRGAVVGREKQTLHMSNLRFPPPISSPPPSFPAPLSHRLHGSEHGCVVPPHERGEEHLPAGPVAWHVQQQAEGGSALRAAREGEAPLKDAAGESTAMD